LATGGTASVTGTVTAGNLATAGTASAGGNVTGANLITGGVVSATGSITSGSTISATANITAGNIITGGQVSATGNITGANLVSAVVTNSAAMTISTTAGNINLNPTGNIVLNSKYINGVNQPVQDNDAASKIYVDNKVTTSISYHEAVVAATTGTLAVATGGTIAYVEVNGAGNGQGAKLTTTGSFNLIDTANVQTVGTRILVKDEGNAAFNGVYTYANATSIVRSTDADTYAPASANALSINDYFFISSGNVNKGSAYIVDEPAGTITFGTSNILFAQFSSSQTYTANTSAGLVLNGTVFSAKVDNNTTAFDGSGNIVVKTSANLTTPNIGAATGTSLSVSGTVTAGNLATAGTASATGNITGGNLITGGLITATGTITSATTITGGNLATAGTASATGTITGGNLATAGTASAGGNVTGANLITGGIVTATGTITGGNLATAGTASAGGNVTGANLITGGVVTATGTITGGNLATGGTASATGTITGGNLATGGTASVTGNITGGNITTAGQANLGNIRISGDDITDTNGRVNFNTAGADVDFAVNGDTVANVFYVDAGVGTASFGAALKSPMPLQPSRPQLLLNFQWVLLASVLAPVLLVWFASTPVSTTWNSMMPTVGKLRVVSSLLSQPIRNLVTGCRQHLLCQQLVPQQAPLLPSTV
jgi:filamentous hemagglutinin